MNFIFFTPCQPPCTFDFDLWRSVVQYHCEYFKTSCFSVLLQVNVETLDPNFVYIQISHATPYYEEGELEHKVTDFERNNNVRRFMYETPFTKDGKAHGEIEEQWKRRTILTSELLVNTDDKMN